MPFTSENISDVRGIFVYKSRMILIAVWTYNRKGLFHSISLYYQNKSVERLNKET